MGEFYLKAIDQGLRVMAYEGDVDACGLSTAPVEDFFTELFKLDGLKQTHPWRPWLLGGGSKVLFI